MDRDPICIDYVLELMTRQPLELVNYLPFNLNLRIRKHVRKKMHPKCTSVDSALENLSEGSIIGSKPEWISIRVELELIQTFLTFFPRWSDTNEVVRKHLGDLVSSIEDAFEMGGHDIGYAIKKGDAEQLDAVRSSLLEKIELFKPIIRVTYDFFSYYKFQTIHHCPIITESDVWNQLCDRLCTNASRLNNERHLGTYLLMQFTRIVSSLQVFGNVCLRHTSDRQACEVLGFPLEGVAICLARLLLLWWVEETDEDDKTIMLSDLMQRIKPTSPYLMGVYIRAINTQNYHSRLRLSYDLVNIVYLPSEGSLDTLLDGLISLITYLIDSYYSQREDVKLLRRDIEKVVCHSASLKYFSIKAHDDGELVLFQLLQKIELLKVEIVLTELRGDGSISKETFVSIYKGLSSVQTVLKCPQDVNSEKLMLIFKRIEQVAREAESLHLPLPANRIQAWRYDDALKFRLFLEFKLMKIQAFLMEQMRCSPSSMFSLKDKIHALNEGLELFYKYLSVLPLENQGDKELILSCIEWMADEERPPSCKFFQSNQVTEHTINEMSLLASNLLEKVNLMNSKIQGTYLQFRSSSVLTWPKTHQGLGFVDLFLEKLSGLMKYKAASVGYSIKHQIEAVLKELDSLKFFLEEVGEKRNENPQLKDLRRRVTRAAYEADYIIDWILLGNFNGCHTLWLFAIMDEMKVIKSELTKIVQMKNDFAEVHDAVQNSEQMITQTSAPEVGEVVVSLKDEEDLIIERLTRGSSARKVVTIVGMPGIGKTTLAKKVYDILQGKNYFRRFAWCCISQIYRRRELLLKILGDIVEISNEIHNKSDHGLIDMLYKGLKGNRYLVVMDDVWSTQAWEELGSAFPDDSNGSRILFTSRYEKVALKVQRDSAPHPLRFLTEDESWKLLQEKVFNQDTCPEELKEVGWTIAKCCNGLPLAVVAVAGILKRTERKAKWWKQIEEDLDSRILEVPENQCMHILELSYNHLPDDLKPCFLYFAAFGEDNEVPVQKLIQLWTAEGFIRKVGQKASLEDVAESYIMDLIDRSLLMAARRGSSGGVKACKVHDMLYNFCLRKVEEENFLKYINGYEKLFPFSTNRLDYGVDSECLPISIAYEQHRLSICSKRKHFVMLKPSGPPVRTLLFFATSDTYPRCPYDDLSFITKKFKLLRVLDIESINIGSFLPKGIELLDSLGYLAISGNIKSVPPTIAKLWNLETFVVKGLMGKVGLPDTIWSMSRLRHLHVNTHATFSLRDGSPQSSSQLHDLVTLSTPVLSHGDNSEEIMKLFPKLRKLRCTFSEPAQHSDTSIQFPNLDFLTELESLKIIYYGSACHSCQLSFPLNVKKLSLSHFSLTWDDFSAVEELRNLKVLKLVSVAFDSPTWDMKDDEFQQLEYLKLDSLKIVEWNASSDHLPNLRQLVLRGCLQLQQVPSSFGEISTLQMIELKWCSASAENSVTPIREQQLEYGNKGFKTTINVPAADSRSSL